MDQQYIMAIDQSTQATKAILLDEKGMILAKAALPHRQIITEAGFVEHDPIEIMENCRRAAGEVLAKGGISGSRVAGLGITCQRETAVLWDRDSGMPVCNAVVWQCARGEAVCERLRYQGMAELVKERTGLKLSPYFSAAKIAWALEHVPGLKKKAEEGSLCCGTVDSWLLYRFTGGDGYLTDVSNASRTQLMNLRTLAWDEEICLAFGIPVSCLPEIRPSDGDFGQTDLMGVLPKRVPIRAVMGDSHGALFGQHCHNPGETKATYGTGSSVMMNTGSRLVNDPTLTASVAWGRAGEVNYVLEGNLNYTGAVITWLKDDLGLIREEREVAALAQSAAEGDKTYLVPAFSGLGAPYWESGARALLSGMGRCTGRAEIVRAAEECIAYQITDIVRLMEESSGSRLTELRVDGGPTRDAFLMQFQSDILDTAVAVSGVEELSATGVGYMAGLALELYREDTLWDALEHRSFTPGATGKWRKDKYDGWKQAVNMAITSKNVKSV